MKIEISKKGMLFWMGDIIASECNVCHCYTCKVVSINCGKICTVDEDDTCIGIA